MMHQHIKQDVPLAPYTTFGIGGSAEYLAEARSEAEIIEATRWSQDRGVQFRILGGGSNVLVSDAGVRGLVVHVRIGGIEYEEFGQDVVKVHVGAGVSLDDLIHETVGLNLWGLENLTSIPGTVGASPVQNVGAYGVETKDIIESVRIVDRMTETVCDLTPEECMFGYRDSCFKHEGGKHLVVTRVTFRLTRAPHPKLGYGELKKRFPEGSATLGEIRDAVKEIRAAKLPDWRTLGTAGSFFKNPIVNEEEFYRLKSRFPGLPSFSVSEGKVKLPLGWLLDEVLALKGYREGNVGLYEKQALVIVNHGGATAAEVEQFAQKIIERVREEFNINIEREVQTFW